MLEAQLRHAIAGILEVEPDAFNLIRMFGRLLVVWRVPDAPHGAPEDVKWGMARVYEEEGEVRLDAI